MSSPAVTEPAEPAAPAPAPEVKDEMNEEESIVADTNAPAVDVELPPAATSQGLVKKDFELMSRIVHRITEFKDEEYVFISSIRVDPD